MINIHDAEAYIIKSADVKHHNPLRKLELIQCLALAQDRYLSKYHKPMFNARFTSSVFGPNCRTIFFAYGDLSTSTYITEPSKCTRLNEITELFELSMLDEQEIDVLSACESEVIEEILDCRDDDFFFLIHQTEILQRKWINNGTIKK